MKTKITREDLENILSELPRYLVAEFGLFCARDVEHLSEDLRVKACNDCLEGYLLGQRSLTELKAAVYASRAAASVSDSACAAAYAGYVADSVQAAICATYAAAYAATASNKDLDFYHNRLLEMLQELTEVEKLIWLE